ncbi:hypothetical protein SAMN05518668_11629 [Sphingobium sp. YR657]|nr:hypothetical protein SAMN05518668_11629 [Sphingobium sp. YR657]
MPEPINDMDAAAQAILSTTARCVVADCVGAP